VILAFVKQAEKKEKYTRGKSKINLTFTVAIVNKIQSLPWLPSGFGVAYATFKIENIDFFLLQPVKLPV